MANLQPLGYEIKGSYDMFTTDKFDRFMTAATVVLALAIAFAVIA